MTKSHHSSDEGEANGFSTKGKANGRSCSPEGIKSGITCESEITFKMISERFKDYILYEKPGLTRFYKSNTSGELDDCLKEPVERALHMANTIRHKGCSWETCLSLSLIALYDIVMLIDNSLSMKFSEEGKRLKTLHHTLKAVSAVYSLASEGKGINVVKLLNSPKIYRNVGPGNIEALKKELEFEGLTFIGTKLREKILKPHAGHDMRRPLLVLIVTDAQIEGEVCGLLRQVIEKKTEELEREYGSHGPEAVAYQFAKIGNDRAARELVEGLDDDETLGDYIDCLDETQLEGIAKRRWEILPKLLLGAISRYWDGEDVTCRGGLEHHHTNLPHRKAEVIERKLETNGDDGFGSDEEDESEDEHEGHGHAHWHGNGHEHGHEHGSRHNDRHEGVHHDGLHHEHHDGVHRDGVHRDGVHRDGVHHEHHDGMNHEGVHHEHHDGVHHDGVHNDGVHHEHHDGVNHEGVHHEHHKGVHNDGVHNDGVHHEHHDGVNREGVHHEHHKGVHHEGVHHDGYRGRSKGEDGNSSSSSDED